ncbi:hypothetical protein BO71DRAFT_420304 [Aspergillus ellipticus CBS 707.79]|uniref:DUF6594 domain-containing protein n=1 Tax=Aspergillus ellipticus CBS 707.79 TaxID=1448320 RepID=A0A319DY48_9EURO|nr:hypothetical protein BO71DRAFT_420304 [Aspergillus ellipticus CBS 707.79]
MALDPGSCIFRRFAKLNAQNLLYLQAELENVQTDLDEIAWNDHCSDSEEKQAYAFNVWRMQDSLNQESPEYSVQWRKVLEARKLLKEYNEALLQQAELLRFGLPDDTDVDIIEQWVDREQVDNRKPLSPKTPWDENEDLIALRSRHEGADEFTRWVYKSVIPWFHQNWGVHDKKQRHLETNVWNYNNRTIKKPLITIFVYNMVFVLVMALMVRARRVDIFATATAFAAVQVTMITNGNCGS